MLKYLLIAVTTAIVGIGVWWGVFMISTVHGLIAEAMPLLFTGLSWFARAAGLGLAFVWAWRRTCDSPIRVVEQCLFLFALLSCIYRGLFYERLNGYPVATCPL